MQLWKEYIAEREDAHILYNNHAFATYKIINQDEVFVMDVFVSKEHRKNGAIHALWDDFIKQLKPKIVYGMTDRKALNWEYSDAFMLAFGFTAYTEENSIIYYYREIL